MCDETQLHTNNKINLTLASLRTKYNKVTKLRL